MFATVTALANMPVTYFSEQSSGSVSISNTLFSIILAAVHRVFAAVGVATAPLHCVFTAVGVATAVLHRVFTAVGLATAALHRVFTAVGVATAVLHRVFAALGIATAAVANSFHANFYSFDRLLNNKLNKNDNSN